ncbi:hypothetical protein ACFWBH_19205 [Streptomyces sp. NPDC059999]|uniref:hypothetical protein n=1 Tax=Streptomyces sp. NPDC059999 TaxID=3347030 RepID=UPI0036C6D69B
MSDGQTRPTGGAAKKKQDQKDAGAFGAVRRRRPPAPQANLAATLLQQAEEVADAGFMGNASALASPSPVTAVLAPKAPVTVPPAAVPTPEPTPRPEPTVPGAGDLPPLHHVVTAPPQESEAREPSAPAPATPGPAAAEAGDDEPEAVGAVPEQKAAASTPPSAPPAQKPRKATRTTGQLEPTHQAIHASFADSRTNSRDWTSHGANLIPEVWDALRSRIANDRRSSGNAELAAGHYMDVVYRQAPMDAQELVVLYKKLSDQRLGYLGSGKKSTFRLGPEAKAHASEIKALLDEADYARKGLYVVSALVILHLQTLEVEGPLRKPELPPLF